VKKQIPSIYKVDYGQEEAAAVQGAAPREYIVSSSKFEGDENGNVKAEYGKSTTNTTFN